MMNQQTVIHEQSGLNSFYTFASHLFIYIN